MCLDHFSTCHPRVLYDQALADVRSTGAGTKCLYCRGCSNLRPYAFEPATLLNIHRIRGFVGTFGKNLTCDNAITVIGKNKQTSDNANLV